VTEECFGGPFLLATQSLFGTFLQAIMVGAIIAKLARPKKRAQNILFSRNAVISHRDGIPCLMFRIADTRKSFIVQAQINARLVRKKVTKEGELLDFYQQNLVLSTDECNNQVLLMWPTTIIHKIDRNSPLYELSAHDLKREQQFEIIVIVEGAVESTGLAAQARTSYLANEIIWGHRFQSMLSYNNGHNVRFIINSLVFEVNPFAFRLTSNYLTKHIPSKRHSFPPKI
jgi:potassium inwardly-rectifying channel subfamily J